MKQKIVPVLPALILSLACSAVGCKTATEKADGAPADSAGAGAGGEAAPTTDAPAASASAAEKAPSFEELVAQSAPLEIKTEEQLAGTIRVDAQRCEIEGGPLLAKSSMEVFKSIEVVGDRVYVLGGKEHTVHAFTVEPGEACKLSIDKSFGTDGVLKLERSSRLASDGAGNLWVSSGVFGATRYDKTGQKTAQCDARPLGTLYVHPDGKFGIGTFANSTVAKVSLPGAEGNCTSEAWAFQDLGQAAKRKGPFTNAQAVGFSGNTIYMGAIVAKEVDPKGPTVVAILDQAGKEKGRFGSAESGDQRFGWIHSIEPCKQGVCVLDSNMRRLTLWKANGDFLGKIDLGKLLGLRYPWISEFQVTPKGAWFIAGQDRAVKGVGEGNIYRVTGL